MLFVFSCQNTKETQDRLIIDRLEYIYHVKKLINSSIWPGFTDKKFDVPLIYYTETHCFVVNPKQLFINQFDCTKITPANSEIDVYVSKLVDQIPFHMSASILFGDSIVDYNYHSPYIKSSSVEITTRTIPDVKTTEEWATMIIHEYFHGFQYQHKNYLSHIENNVFGVTTDSLVKIYTSQDWFRTGVDQENTALLQAINTTNNDAMIQYIDEFFELRDNRRDRTKKDLSVDISIVEAGYETLEGTARYVEFSLYDHFSDKIPDPNLLKSDTIYCSYNYFKDFDIDKNDWLFQTGKTTYFYATGFNITRLLDKVGIVYKERLFNEPRLTLEELLKSTTAEIVE